MFTGCNNILIKYISYISSVWDDRVPICLKTVACNRSDATHLCFAAWNCMAHTRYRNEWKRYSASKCGCLLKRNHREINVMFLYFSIERRAVNTQESCSFGFVAATFTQHV